MHVQAKLKINLLSAFSPWVQAGKELGQNTLSTQQRSVHG